MRLEIDKKSCLNEKGGWEQVKVSVDTIVVGRRIIRKRKYMKDLTSHWIFYFSFIAHFA